MPDSEIHRIQLDTPDLTSPVVPITQVRQSTTTTTAQAPLMTKKRTPHKKAFGFVGGVILVLLLLIGGVGLFTWSTVQALKGEAQQAKTIGEQAYDSFKSQDLPGTQQNLQKLQSQIAVMQGTYSHLGFYKFVPVANNYYNDGTHGLNAAAAGVSAGLKSIDAVSPYADVLGFSGAKFTGGTAEDRLKILLSTLDKISPQLDNIASDLEVSQKELAQINPNRYPENFRGTPVRSYITEAQTGVNGAVSALTNYRPVLTQLPAMAGSNGQRTYLILFQNDNELRPTGGFLTAYSIIDIDSGKVTPETSDDIYTLDQKFNSRIPIPAALGKYLTTEKYWNLRDMNTSPDFKTSMTQFDTYYKTLPGSPKDLSGIVGVDTHVLVDLLKILGPVNVPGFGTFSADNDPHCNCPEVTYALSQIITRPTPYIKTDPKGVLGPLMRGILNNAYTAPKDKWPTMIQTVLADVAQRHVQFDMFNDQEEAAMNTINAAGTMQPVTNSDFLAVIDANLGGAKSNLFTDSAITQTVSAPSNGVITKTLEIKYTNHRAGDNCNLAAGLLCLNSTMPDWNRLYLPSGAQLTDAEGYTTKPQTYNEAGFAVVDGFFILQPNSESTIKVTYTVPYTDTKTYRVHLWKQAGVNAVQETFNVNGSQDQVTVDQDKDVSINF